MEGKGSGGFWYSTAAMITAIATLLTAVVGLAVFLVGQQWFGDPESDNWTPRPGMATASPVRINNNDVRSGPQELRITELMAIELDTVPPDRDVEYGGDLYIWGGAEMSSIHGIFVWPGKEAPSATDCASYLALQSLKGDYVPFAEGTHLCVRTDEGRTCRVTVKARDSNDSWLVDVTVWQPRT